ncbi:MAG: DNA-methyltransferase [Halobacteriota archaeon]
MPSNIVYKFGNCLDLIKEVPDGSICMAVTSPPYNLRKQYGEYHDSVSLSEWKELINAITGEIYRVLAPNGSFFLNVSPVPFGSHREILPLPFVAYEILKDNQFYLRNMITWTFNNMQNCTNRLSGRYENVIWGVKDLKNYIFNLNDVKIPYITQNDKRLTGSGRNPTDVWYFDRVNNMTKQKLKLTHPTIYPLPMIERIIKMSTNPEDTVLDPFLGSGTTLVAAKRLGRNGVGFELDRKYEDEIERRLRIEGHVVHQNKLMNE